MIVFFCIVLYCIVRHLGLLVYHIIKRKIIEGFVDLWYFVAFKLLIFPSRLCPLLENFCPVVRTFLCGFVLTYVSSINSSSASTKREAIVAENFNQEQILLITSLQANLHQSGSSNHALLITKKALLIKKKCPLSQPISTH